jgi:hypothetical protein
VSREKRASGRRSSGRRNALSPDKSPNAADVVVRWLDVLLLWTIAALDRIYLPQVSLLRFGDNASVIEEAIYRSWEPIVAAHYAGL